MLVGPHYLVRGLFLGLAIAAPVGPIGILCIHRTLTHGRLHGFVSGLGAATADAMYGAVAAFGLTFISQFIAGEQTWLRLLGGVLLCYLGYRAYSAPAIEERNGRDRNLLQSYASTLLLTLSNPLTILAFAAIFAALGLIGSDASRGSATLLVAGVFLGSALWWFLLSGGTNRMRQRMARHMLHINRVSGALIGAFGVVVLLRAM
jgi:threonine/homoserine/homoserine lactone efflux protein